MNALQIANSNDVGFQSFGRPSGVPVGEDGRSSERIRTLYRVGRLTSATDSGLCRVQNISDGGMMLFTSMVLEVGEVISLALSDEIRVSATVVWIDEVRLGVRFPAPIDSAALLRSLGDERLQGRQRAPRLPVNATAIVTNEGRSQAVRVVDISQFGLKIAHDGSLQQDSAVKVALPNWSDRRAVVRWSDKDMAGLRLAEPIPYTSLESAARL